MKNRAVEKKNIGFVRFSRMSVRSNELAPTPDREVRDQRTPRPEADSETKGCATAEVSGNAFEKARVGDTKRSVAEDEDGVEPPQNAAHSLLSDRAILEHMQRGTVVIRPFVRANLSTSSYDVTLGSCYYRETPPESGSSTLYNPFSRAMVERVWGGVCTAERADEWAARAAVAPLENIAPDDRVIVLAPGETILAHTNEFIGGRGRVNTMMKARSSLGRNFIEVCKCAGNLLSTSASEQKYGRAPTYTRTHMQRERERELYCIQSTRNVVHATNTFFFW